MKIMRDFLRIGYCLYADMLILLLICLYCSIALTKQMRINEMLMCGTLRADRQGNPKGVVKANLNKREMIQRSKDGISVTEWKDKKMY